MSCQQVPTTPAFNLYPRSVQVGEFEVAIDGGIWVAIRVHPEHLFEHPVVRHSLVAISLLLVYLKKQGLLRKTA